jgi:hypothetical protein
MPLLPHAGPHWWEHQEARAAELRAEGDRVAVFYAAQERAREERENAEVCARVDGGDGT